MLRAVISIALAARCYYTTIQDRISLSVDLLTPDVIDRGSFVANQNMRYELGYNSTSIAHATGPKSLANSTQYNKPGIEEPCAPPKTSVWDLCNIICNRTIPILMFNVCNLMNRKQHMSSQQRLDRAWLTGEGGEWLGEEGGGRRRLDVP